MRSYWINKLLLIAAGCLAGLPSRAQLAAVAPLAPRQVLVQPTAPSLGVPLRVNLDGPPPPAAYTAQPTRPVIQPPVFLLNARTLLGSNLDEVVKPNDIAKIDIYRRENAPPQWRSLAQSGIVSLTLKPGVKLKLRPKSLAAIRRQLGLAGEVSFELNGLPIEDASLRVAAAAIAGLDVRRKDGVSVVNIRLLLPKSIVHPPGTILIRGVATN